MKTNHNLDLTEYTILGTKVNPLTMEQLNHGIDRIIRAGDKAIVANVNVHALNLTFDHPWYRKFINDSAIVFCDGAGVKLGAKILGYQIPYRITPADWVWSFSEYAQNKDITFYFLGARKGIAEKAANKLKAKFPNLKIVGTHHGYFDKTSGSEENEQIIAMINKVRPNVLFVGFGMPLQEEWLRDNWEKIDANVALDIGALFDYISEELKRAPKWMTNNGLEWLGRMIIEPKRLWKRYVVGNPIFLWRVLMEKIGMLRFS